MWGGRVPGWDACGVFSCGFDLKEMGNGPQDALELTSLGSKFARRMMFAHLETV